MRGVVRSDAWALRRLRFVDHRKPLDSICASSLPRVLAAGFLFRKGGRCFCRSEGDTCRVGYQYGRTPVFSGRDATGRTALFSWLIAQSSLLLPLEANIIWLGGEIHGDI
jgi:hypothetical protein